MDACILQLAIFGDKLAQAEARLLEMVAMYGQVTQQILRARTRMGGRRLPETLYPEIF